MSITIAGCGESSSVADFKNHRKLHREAIVHGFKYEDRKIVRSVGEFFKKKKKTRWT